MSKAIRVALFFGIVAGILYFLFFLLLYFVEENPLSNKIAPLGAQFILVLYAILHFKRKNGGYLHFYEGFSIGFLSNLLASLLGGILIYAFLEVIDMEPFEVWIRESVAFLLEDRESKKEIMSDNAFRAMLTAVKNSKPSTVILDRVMAAFWLVFPIGLFCMVMRKIKPSN